MAVKNSSVKWFSLIIGLIILILVVSTSNTSAQAKPAPTPSATPTRTLAQQVGFYDARLKQIAAKGISHIQDRVDFTAYGHKFRLLSFDALWADSLVMPGTVLLYQTDIGQPKLIWEQTTNVETPFLKSSTPLPGDWFNDGTLYFGIWSYWWTTAWSVHNLTIYNLRPDNSVNPISMDFVPKGYAAGAIEEQADGTPLLVTDDYRDGWVMGLDKWSIYMCCGPYLHRYFQRKDGKFIDVSADFSYKYFPEMGSALQYITTLKPIKGDDNADRLYALNLLRLLVIYEDIGERDAGWSLVQTLVSQSKQSGRLPDHTYVDDVFMPWAEQLYKDHKPFVAPDCRDCQ
jgi:hypothetical protein